MRETILIVDDCDLIREHVAYMFNELGFDSVSCGTRAEVLTKLATGWHPDLVISDFNSPGMFFEEFLAKLREIDAHMPVLLMTGFYGGVTHVVNRVNAVLYKPFTMAALERTLRQALGAGLVAACEPLPVG